MAHHVIIRDQAEVDITDAAIWYHNSNPAWAKNFSPRSK
jgi:hypothetical protein